MNTRIANNRQDFERKVARIRSNPDLNDEARRRMIQEAYEEADARHQELAGEQRRKENERIFRLERDVMGIRYPMHATDGEKELARMSYRDACDRAERAASADDTDNVALSTLLERAERSGDPRLVEAVYHVATERGLRGGRLLPRGAAGGEEEVGGVLGGQAGGLLGGAPPVRHGGPRPDKARGARRPRGAAVAWRVGGGEGSR